MNRASQLFLTLGVLFLFAMVFGPDVAPPRLSTPSTAPLRGPSSVGDADASYADLYCRGTVSRKTAQVIADDGTVGYKDADLKVGFAQILALTQDEAKEFHANPTEIHKIIKRRADGLCRLFDARFPESKKFATSGVLDGPVFNSESSHCLRSSAGTDTQAKPETLVFKALVCAAESEPVVPTEKLKKSKQGRTHSPNAVQ